MNEVKMCSKHRVAFSWEAKCDVCKWQDARTAAINEAITEVRSGRTITNFSHVPEVVRALEWIWMDLQKLRDKHLANSKQELSG